MKLEEFKSFLMDGALQSTIEECKDNAKVQQMKLTDIKSFTGEAEFVTVRGKKKLGYELAVTMVFTLPKFDVDDIDDDFADTETVDN